MDELVVDIVRLPLAMPAMPLEITIALKVATAVLHRFIAERLKLTDTPACTSRQRLNGNTTGFFGHAGCGIT